MSEKLIITEVFRFPVRKYEWQMKFVRPRIYCFEVPAQQVLKRKSVPEAYFDDAEYALLRNCYHYNGARGVTSGPEFVYIGLQNRIVAYDNDLEEVRFTIDHPLLNGVHELDFYENRLYVTCAVTDSILVFDGFGEYIEAIHLGSHQELIRAFSLEARCLDSRIDYRIMHRASRLYHVNSVQASDSGVFVNLNRQGAFVQLFPEFCILVASPEMKFSHNGCFSPDGEHILINDTAGYTLRVFGKDGEQLSAWDLRDYGIPVDFQENRTFEGSHKIRAGWLRGLDFSRENQDIVYLGLSPAMIVAFDYMRGDLLWYHQFRRNVWASIHGIHVQRNGKK